MSDEAARMIERLRDVDEDALYDAPWTAEQLCKQAAALIASQQAEIARLRDALQEVRDDILHPRNHRAIIDTVWHSDIETTVDFIDIFLDEGSAS